jgi:hypothetical protein
MHVDLLNFSSGEEQVMATVRVSEGKLRVEGKVPVRVLQTLEFERDEAEDDEAFLKNLPRVFSGAYLRARFVD